MCLPVKNFVIILSILIPLSSSGQTGNEILNYKTIIKADKKKLIIEKSFLIQVNTPGADWIADIKIPFSDDNRVELIEASIINAQGVAVRNIRKKDIITRSSISEGTFYEDHYIKTFSLKWSDYPYRIKYSYRKVLDEFIHLAHWYPILYTHVPTKNARLEIELPQDYEVALDYSGKLEYRSDTLDGSIIHRWSLKQIPAFEQEIFAPPYQELLPFVSAVPKAFDYGLEGSFDSWQSFGQWQTQLNEGLDLLPPLEKVKVDQLITGIDDKQEIIKTLFHYLQDNTRYINVAIDIGGLKPYPASYVSQNKYGDCKALTMYMKALLKHAGIPSYYTDVYADANPVGINRSFPSQQFNHVILCVPLKEDTIWLENTSNYLPYNYMGTFTQDRFGFLVNGKNSQLVKIPALESRDVLVENTYIFYLNENGEGTATIRKKLRGSEFENYKYFQYAYQLVDQQQFLSKNPPIENSQVITWRFLQPNRDEKQLSLDIELRVRDQFRRLGDIITFRPVPHDLPDFETPGSRKHPVRFNFPVNQSDSMVYHLPFLKNYHLEVPEKFTIESKYGRYMEEFTQNEVKLIVRRKIQMHKGTYPLEEYQKLYLFFDAIKKHQQQSTIIINPIIK